MRYTRDRNLHTPEVCKSFTVTGFTLVEILITTALIGVIGFAVYASLNQGIKTWRRLSLELPGQEINIFFDILARDLRNTFRFNQIEFRGSPGEIKFATLVRSQSQLEGLRLNVGEVVYSFDRDSKTLNRRQRNFSELYKGAEADEDVLLRGVQEVNFQYYFYDAKSKEYLWCDEWTEEGLPKAVRINMHLESDKQGKGFITRTIGIPVVGY